MRLLSIKVSQTDPDHNPLKILVSVEKPFESEAPSELPFEEDVALRAVLKALEATGFIGGDFTEEELGWLRREHLVGGSPGNFYHSHKMREEIGQKLWGSVVPTEKTRGIYDQVRRESREAREEIHFQLCFSAQAPLVGAYPWELLYHEGDFLVGGGRGTLTRYITFDTPPPFRSVPDTLTVLLIVPRPIDPELALLGYAEARAVRQGVETAKGQISLEPQEVSSFATLEAYLSEHSGDDAPHIIHFDGHGAFGRRCPQCGVLTTSRTATRCDNPQCSTILKDLEPQGYLAFQGNQGRTEYRSARAFADLLRQALVTGEGQAQGGTRLVVLSACRSGVARGVGNVFNGVAQRLMEAGVPAVVAMQFSIRADAATRFAERFYERVAKRDALVTAMSWGRTVLGREGDQWYRPVLYLRWRDNEGGRLFAGPPPVVFSPEWKENNLDFRQVKARSLKKRLEKLSEEYEAATRQLDSTLSAAESVRIKRQIETIEEQVRQVEAELNSLQ